MKLSQIINKSTILPLAFSGLLATSSVSADTDRIVFVAEKTGNVDIYSAELDGSHPSRLTFDRHADNFPVYSPDGREIVFASTRPNLKVFEHNDRVYDIHRMNADGTGIKNVTNNPRRNDIEPDIYGTEIVFSSTDVDHFNFDICKIDESGEITNLTNNPYHDLNPKFSPDGSQILFSSSRNGNREIYVMDADGSNPINLTNNSGFDKDPSWSPDGNKIAFASNRDEGFEIYIMNNDGSDVTRLTYHELDIANPIFGDNMFMVTTYTDDHIRSNVCTMDLNGDNLTNITGANFNTKFGAWDADFSLLSNTTTQVEYTTWGEVKDTWESREYEGNINW
jgi:Tol biopolymer transport system component